MRLKIVLIGLVLLVGVGTGSLLLHRREPDVGASSGDEALEPLVESPRPPIRLEVRQPTLKGRPPSQGKAAENSDRASMVRQRNDLAREHRRLVAAYEEGTASVQEMEEAEMRLLDARHRLGEIDGPSCHRARALLITRTVERTNLAVEAGMVPAANLDRVSLSLELERLLAGDGNEYAAKRDAFLASVKNRNATMVMAGLASAKSLQEEYERLEVEYPAADLAMAQNR